jgi:predicted AlkP superfamily pyrophosphatase or phosphodiesterase
MKTFYSQTHSLVNLANTLLAHYHAPTHHQPIPSLLKRLKGKDKIVFLLFDGMGQTILRQHLPIWSWLRRQTKLTITSTFPSTTAAATNAFLSGRYPNEIGWLGWSSYFPEHDQFLELFTGRDYLKQQPAFKPEDVQATIQYKSIFEQIQQGQPNLKIHQVWPDIKPGGAKDFPSWIHQLNTACDQPGPSLTYGYWLDPDKTIHKLGVADPSIHTIVSSIQSQLKTLSQQHKDTTFVIFADHGLVDVSFLNIQTYSALYQMLIRSFGLEPRAATFYVKPDFLVNFKETFLRYYGKHFILMSKQEAVSQHLYGLGLNHPRFNDFVGDFIAIAKGSYAFTPGLITDTMPSTMKAHHAGMTKKEMLIDVMVVNG